MGSLSTCSLYTVLTKLSLCTHYSIDQLPSAPATPLCIADYG